jgi:hypothetical protein
MRPQVRLERTAAAMRSPSWIAFEIPVRERPEFEAAGRSHKREVVPSASRSLCRRLVDNGDNLAGERGLHPRLAGFDGCGQAGPLRDVWFKCWHEVIAAMTRGRPRSCSSATAPVFGRQLAPSRPYSPPAWASCSAYPPTHRRSFRSAGKRRDPAGLGPRGSARRSRDRVRGRM